MQGSIGLGHWFTRHWMAKAHSTLGTYSLRSRVPIGLGHWFTRHSMAKAHSTWGTYLWEARFHRTRPLVHKALNSQGPQYLRDLLVEKQVSIELGHGSQDTQWPRPAVPEGPTREKQGSIGLGHWFTRHSMAKAHSTWGTYSLRSKVSIGLGHWFTRHSMAKAHSTWGTYSWEAMFHRSRPLVHKALNGQGP
jgi:hypothetical protein